MNLEYTKSQQFTQETLRPTSGAIGNANTVLVANFDGNNGSTIFLDKNLIAQDIRFSNGATATAFTLVDYADFGAEVRSIASSINLRNIWNER